MRSPLHRAGLEASGGVDRREEVSAEALPQNGTEGDGTGPSTLESPRAPSDVGISLPKNHAPTGNPSLRSGRTTGRSREALFRAGLLRKEVIQPHLPVRLPCYDFTPIANPTFDSSSPKGLGHWLRVLPTFVV